MSNTKNIIFFAVCMLSINVMRAPQDAAEYPDVTELSGAQDADREIMKKIEGIQLNPPQVDQAADQCSRTVNAWMEDHVVENHPGDMMRNYTFPCTQAGPCVAKWGEYHVSFALHTRHSITRPQDKYLFLFRRPDHGRVFTAEVKVKDAPQFLQALDTLLPPLE